MNRERRSKRKQDADETKGDGSSSEELEDYGDSDSGSNGEMTTTGKKMREKIEKN